MKARITVVPDVNILALHRMLAENGLWLVQVHNGHVVKITKVPKGESVSEFVNDDGSDPVSVNEEVE